MILPSIRTRVLLFVILDVIYIAEDFWTFDLFFRRCSIMFTRINYSFYYCFTLNKCYSSHNYVFIVLSAIEEFLPVSHFLLNFALYVASKALLYTHTAKAVIARNDRMFFVVA